MLILSTIWCGLSAGVNTIVVAITCPLNGEIGQRFNIHPYCRANLTDATANTFKLSLSRSFRGEYTGNMDMPAALLYNVKRFLTSNFCFLGVIIWPVGKVHSKKSASGTAGLFPLK